MSTPNPIDPSKASFSWTPATTNTDGSPIAAGEITGYLLGIRSATDPSSVAGTYPIAVPIGDPSATSEAVSAIGTVLKPDTYAAALESVGPTNSAWTPEITFTIAAPPLPVPNPPSGFTVA